jgi:hypothetical protein
LECRCENERDEFREWTSEVEDVGFRKDLRAPKNLVRQPNAFREG